MIESNHTIELNGSAEQAVYENILGEVNFINFADEPGNRSVYINFTIVDNGFTATAMATVQTVATNDPAFISFYPAKTLSYVEMSQEPLSLFPSDTIHDSDGALLQSVTISSARVFDSYDQLLADVGGSDLMVNYSGSSLVLSGVADHSVYESVMRSVAFFNTFPGLSVEQRTITVVTFDGVTPSPPHLILVDIVPFDDPAICFFEQLVRFVISM